MKIRLIDVDDRMDDVSDRMRVDPELAEEFLAKYELSWLYHENALEGVVYTSQELATALANQPVADATFVSAFQEIRNHKSAMDVVREEAAAKKLRVNLTLVKRLCDTLAQGIEGRNPIELRKDMPLHRAYFHEIVHPTKIAPLFQKVLDACDAAEFRNAHPVQQAARLHHGVMQVFPYTDHSGRLSRLLANLVLLHAGYRLPCIIHATDRQRYYESFRVPDAALRDLTIEALDNALTQAEKFFRETPSRRRKTAR